MNSRVYDKKIYESHIREYLPTECDSCKNMFFEKDMKLIRIRGKQVSKDRWLSKDKCLCGSCYREKQLKGLGL